MDLRIRVRQGEDDGLRCHCGHRLGGHLTGRHTRKTSAPTSAAASEPVRPDWLVADRQLGLHRGQVGSGPGAPHHASRRRRHRRPRRRAASGRRPPRPPRNRRSPPAGRRDRARSAGGVAQRRQHHDRGAVLVVVEDRDGQPLPQPGLDLEAPRRADVLQVDPPNEGASRTTVCTISSGRWCPARSAPRPARRTA